MPMTTTNSTPAVGELLRQWRHRRRLTQLELAHGAGVSARHLSFVETGRSKPGRDMLLRVVERLDIPIRDRNRLLLAAGHAPAFAEYALDDPELTPIREGLERILTSHEPFPAVVFDRHWNLVAANAGIYPLVEGIDPALLTPPINVLRIALELIPKIINARDVMGYFAERVQRQSAAGRDEELAGLMALFDDYLPTDSHSAAGESEFARNLGPVRVHAPGGGEWSFFGMFGTFDMPFEVTISELAVELLFPADRTTAEAFETFAQDRAEG